MTLWRICRAPYADLTGTGSRKYGGRWNSPGRSVVYLSEAATTSLVDVLVHLDLPIDLLPADYVLFGVDPADLDVEEVPDLSAVGDIVAVGDRWIDEARTPLLRIPSVIVPECFNVLLNAAHPEAGKARIIAQRPFAFDARLFDR